MLKRCTGQGKLWCLTVIFWFLAVISWFLFVICVCYLLTTMILLFTVTWYSAKLNVPRIWAREREGPEGYMLPPSWNIARENKLKLLPLILGNCQWFGWIAINLRCRYAVRGEEEKRHIRKGMTWKPDKGETSWNHLCVPRWSFSWEERDSLWHTFGSLFLKRNNQRKESWLKR